MQTQITTLQHSHRVFELHRAADVSGCSGIGVVAHGCVFPDGTAAMRWQPGNVGVSSWTLYGSIDELETLHGHGGRTVVVYPDEQQEQAAPLRRHPRRVPARIRARILCPVENTGLSHI